MTHRKIALVLLALATALPLAALASPGGSGPGGADPGFSGPGFGGPGFGRGQGARGHHGARHLFPPPGYLDLTDEQIDAVEALREDLRARLDGVRDEGRALREQLRAALEGDAPDAARVGQLVIDLDAHRDQVRAVFEDAESRLAALLTEEQLEKWENFKELRAHRRGPRHHRLRGGFGDGPRI